VVLYNGWTRRRGGDKSRKPKRRVFGNYNASMPLVEVLLSALHLQAVYRVGPQAVSYSPLVLMSALFERISPSISRHE